MYHIKDEEFVRAKVPMTKEEVRAISIAKMDIRTCSQSFQQQSDESKIGKLKARI